MSHNTENTMNPTAVAVVGKSALFPVSLSPRAFWPNLISLKGLMSGLAQGQWPFSEAFSADDLMNLKGFVMNSGLLATGSLPADGFEIPPEILKISTVMRIVPLFLANQALADTLSFQNGAIPAERVRVAFETRAHNQTFRLPVSEKQSLLWQQVLRDAGRTDEEIRDLSATVARLTTEGTQVPATADEKGNEDRLPSPEKSARDAGPAELFAQHHGFGLCPVAADAPLPGTITWLGQAVRELQVGSADLVIAGAVDAVHVLIADPLIPVEADGRPVAGKRLREGLGMLALRRLADAERDGDQILAIISDVDASSIGFARPGDGSTASPGPVNTDKPVQEKNAAPKAAVAGDRLSRLARFARLPITDLVESADGSCRNLPFNRFPDEAAIAGPAGSETVSAALSWKLLRECWVKRTGARRFFHDLLGVLMGTFVSRVVVRDPDGFAAVAPGPIIYLANHQIGLESPLFMTLAYGMTGLPIQAVAKPDHVDAWLSFLMDFAQDSLGAVQPFRLMYFDRLNPQGLIDSLKKSGTPEASLLVHVDGTRAVTAGQPVARISSIFLDMAIEKNVPVVPVRFVGGLPDQPTDGRLDFPYGNGKQDYLIGTPIPAEQLRRLPYGQRPKFVMDKINTIGPGPGEDVLLPPSPEFITKTRFFMETFGLPKFQAMLFAILQVIDDPCEETAVLIKAVQAGKIDSSRTDFPPVLKNFLTHMKTKFS